MIALAADEDISEKEIKKVVAALKGLKFESLWYLSYQDGQEKNGTDYSRFSLKRGYLTVKKDIMPWLNARFTADITQVKDEPDSQSGTSYRNHHGGRHTPWRRCRYYGGELLQAG